LNLTIEKLIYGGDGLARFATDTSVRGSQGKAVFVPFTLEAELIEATITEQKSGFDRAQLDRILTPSPNRIPPRCPYFQRCGGCQYQHTTYEHQLAIKAAILKETLRRQAKVELPAEITVHSAEPWHYRNRTRFQLRTTPEFVAGYFRFASHEVLPVEDCPISAPVINRALAALCELGRAAQVPAELREVEFFANAGESRLLAELWFAAPTPPAQRIALGEKFVSLLRDHVPTLTSAYVFPQIPTRGPQPVAEPVPDWALGGGEFRYATAAGDLRVSGGSFFQVNRFLIEKLVELVTTGRAGELALDLYAGVGLFTTALAKSFRHILAVESSPSSAADLKYNSPANAKVIRTTVENFLAGDGKVRHGKPTSIVVDPPRAGLGDRVARALARSDAREIIYVSCDPTTLARDLVHLLAGGYRLDQVHLVDLFPQTFHLETVVRLTR
jgi:23S rRNA (uracil1939-C5)-methyltransferase